MAVAYRTFGDELFSWEPETLDLEFRDEWEVTLPPANLEKLHALISAVVSGAFYHDYSAFLLISSILCGGEDEPLDGADPLLVAEAAWGVTEVRLNDSDHKEKHQWGDEVRRYVGVLCHEEGFVHPPPALRFARMPGDYEGSSYAADLHQKATITTAHARVVEEYVEAQATMLFKQLSMLPWMGPAELSRMAREICG